MGNINPKIGDIVNVAGIDWIILDKSEGSHYFFQDYVLCLSRDLLYIVRFSENSADYSTSDVRTKLTTELLPKLKNAVGADNILDTEISLISSDGSTDYGAVIDKVGLLTEDIYLKYKNIIEQYEIDDWWWLATQHEDCSCFVRCVDDVGILGLDRCDYVSGIRPFVRFNPRIFNLNQKEKTG